MDRTFEEGDAVFSDRSDEQLWAAFVNSNGKDNAFFLALVERYKNRLFGFAIKLQKDRFKAEDCVQEAFMKIYHHASSGSAKEVQNFESWVFRILLNLFRDSLRRPTETPLSENEVVSYAEVQDIGLGPLESLIAKEQQAAFWQCVEKLPERQKNCLYLKVLCNMSTKAIAEEMGLAVGTVSPTIMAAKNNIRKCMGKNPEVDDNEQ